MNKDLVNNTYSFYTSTKTFGLLHSATVEPLQFGHFRTKGCVLIKLFCKGIIVDKHNYDMSVTERTIHLFTLFYIMMRFCLFHNLLRDAK